MSHYLINEEKNGIEIYFDSKPNDAVISELKEAHFRWYPPKGCWYNKNTLENETIAKKICGSSSSVHSSNTRQSYSPPPVVKSKYPKSTHRMADHIFIRDSASEKPLGIDEIRIYGFYRDNDMFSINGQIFAQKHPDKPFFLSYTIYDKDGDIIDAGENMGYGEGLSTKIINPSTFFNGFPFEILLFNIPKKDIDKILIVPTIG